MAEVRPSDYILEKIRLLCPKDFTRDEIEKLTINQTGIGSLEFMELIMEIEDNFKMDISDDMITNDLTIYEFCILIENLIRG